MDMVVHWCTARMGGVDLARSKPPYDATVLTRTLPPPPPPSTFQVQPCPPNSTSGLANGCTCNAGFDGAIIASSNVDPFYTGTCKSVQCPEMTNGVDVSSGCVCLSGMAGGVTPTSVSPFFTSSCSAVPCPVNSAGNILALQGCICGAGFSGSVVSTNVAPFYTSTCEAVACPSSSNGITAVVGCACNAGYSGAIVISSTSPYFTPPRRFTLSRISP